MRKPTHHTLIFHRVLANPDPMNPSEPTAGWFEGLMRSLKARFDFISVDEAVGRAREGRLNGRTLSVTFDDGYADNYTIALPILSKLEIPATFFVASSYLDGGRMWNDAITETFRRLPPGRHDIDLPGQPSLEISDEVSRYAAASSTIAAWKHLPQVERQSKVDALADRVGDMPNDLMMTSGQLRAMAGMHGATIGGHTRTHPILSCMEPDEARDEIEGGKADLEGILDREVTLFAYPNGKWEQDYRAEHSELVRAAGFDAAVATDWGVLSSRDDLFRIPRFTPWHSSYSRFIVDLARCQHGLL